MYSIYIVDDEPLIIQGLINLIPWELMDCTLAGSSINSLQAQQELRDISVDILITDLRMPSLNGIELIKTIKKENTQTKIIVLSGYNDFSDVKSTFQLGIENYLLKPINEQELTSTLESCIEKLIREKNQQTLTLLNQEIIRNNTLNRWLKGDSSYFDIKERGSLLALPLKYRCYQVGLLKPFIHYTRLSQMARPQDQQPPTQNIYMNLYNFIQDYFTKDASPLLFITDKNEIAFIFYGQKSNLFTNILENKIKDIIWHTNIKHQLNLFFGLGQVYQSAKNIPKSHKEALQALRKRFSTKEPLLIYHPDDHNKAIEQSIYPLINSETLTKLILHKDLDSIHKHIEKLIHTLHAHTHHDATAFYQSIFYLLLTFHAVGEELGHDIIHHEHFTYDTLTQLGTLEDVISFIYHYAKILIASLGKPNLTKSPIVLQVIQEVQASYSTPLSIKDLSQKYKVNATYLGQLFKQETGDTFNSYLNKYRINKSKELLLDGSLNLKAGDVAKEVGYSNPNYFYRMFKKYMGLSPREIKIYRHS